MLKTKKRSFCLILSLVMLLAMACGAWAATAAIEADGQARPNESGDISETGMSGYYGLWAHNSGSIGYTGNINLSGTADIHGIFADMSSDIISVGDVAVSRDLAVPVGGNVRGVYLFRYSSGNVIGIVTAKGLATRGLFSRSASNLIFKGNVEATGDRAVSAYAYGDSYLSISGDATLCIPGEETLSDPTRRIYGAAVGAFDNSSVDIVDDAIVVGDYGYGIWASTNSIVNMSDGEIKASSHDHTWALGIVTGSTINLTNVVVDSENQNLLKNDTYINNETDSSGTVNATDSTLVGNILQDGAMDGAFDIYLTDSTWTGAAEASGDINTIDITLTGSAWYITASSDTNGRLTGDVNSLADFNGTTDNITVEIGSLGGDFDLDIKVGDTLIIKDGSSVGNMVSSDPDVVEIVKNPDGSISIISKGEGDVEITYAYVDGSGNLQTGTIGVSSGAGSTPSSYSGGGSSNCNAGMGASALLTLLGLAVVLKKK